jgi:hypothetical protein
LETFTESPSRVLALLGEWEVSEPGVLARQGPCGLTVSRQIDYGNIVFQCVISPRRSSQRLTLDIGRDLLEL